MIQQECAHKQHPWAVLGLASLIFMLVSTKLWPHIPVAQPALKLAKKPFLLFLPRPGLDVPNLKSSVMHFGPTLLLQVACSGPACSKQRQ